MSAVRYWLLTSPRTSSRSGARSGPDTVTGRWPQPSPAADRRTHRDKRIVQRRHRPSAQRRRAVDRVRTRPERGERGDEPRRGAGQRAGSSIGPGENTPPVPPIVVAAAGSVAAVHADAEQLQAVEHRLGVVAVGDVAQRGLAVGERRAHERAVGDALRARAPSPPHRSARAAVRLDGCPQSAPSLSPAAARPDGSRVPSAHRGTARHWRHRPARRRHHGCPRRCAPLRSWRC